MRLVSAIYDDFYPFQSLLSGDIHPKDNMIASQNPDDLDETCILLLWGGEDISPSLYNQKVSIRGGGSPEPNRRDRIEWAMLQRAIQLDIPIIGICRGAQMLCAAAGGKLIQHLNNHAGYMHEITTIDGRNLRVNSLHHQLQYPFEVDHKMLAWSTKTLSDVYYDEDKILTEIPCEPELVIYPKIRGIAAQWHPEMMQEDVPATQYLLKVIKDEIHI